ncbi:RNA 2',3'-cyclic phosphodiesterase [Streptomyces megasporus]|uniref:RNA 2',3'-cyclic phosphodiesterase n=1 Tax=Streptomyces megasporus TaxID=44060 RepID=UPI0004E1B222|nr:RNA 2',3'-cyclic phosphodiesterase [Streptomyces megasporus]
MRLFTAVLPPPGVLTELEAAVDRLKGLPDADRLRWARPEGWHFTLAFLGEVDEALLPELRERLARAAHRHPAFGLRLAGGGRFGDRVLWIGVEGDHTTLRRLADSVTAAVRRAGVPTEDRPYKPHLTVARAGRTAHRVDLRPFVASLDGFSGSDWQAREVALVRSFLPSSGVPGEHPRYETLEAWSLDG